MFSARIEKERRALRRRTQTRFAGKGKVRQENACGHKNTTSPWIHSGVPPRPGSASGEDTAG